MLICLCNALSDRDVNCASEQANGSVSAVFKNLGCRPNCGQCVPYIRDHITADIRQQS